jgi:uracil-DNA glycosylase
MIWEKFKDLFHPSWKRKLKPFIESSECDKIYQFLKSEAARGRKIAPLSSNVWRAFKETSFDDLNVVFLGISPYHTFKDNAPIADGILMSCSITGKLQPSLEKFYSEIERQLYEGLNLHLIKDPDLSYLSKQGILMTNIGLTCEEGKPGSHSLIWSGFTQYLLEEVLAGTGVPIVFLGKEAARYERYVAPFTHKFVVPHPASAAYSQEDWNSDNLFKKLNKHLKDCCDISIQWMKTSE